MGVSIKNPTDFANALLGALGIQPSKQNVTDIVGWENTEGGNWHNPDKYNPLDTTLDLPGAVSTNSVGVKAYTSWQQGIDATVQTLENSNPAYGYSGVISALENNDSWTQFTQAVENSSWGGKGNKYLSQFPTPPGVNDPSSGKVTPDSQEANVGSSATTASDQAGNSPSTTNGSAKLSGMAGILQSLNTMYNPVAPSGESLGKPLAFITNVPTDIENTIVMLATRSISAVLSVMIIIVGLKTLLGGSSESGGGGSSGSSNTVLEFVNNQKRTNLSAERIKTRQQEESDRSARHTERLRVKQADIEAKNYRSDRWADIHEEYATNPRRK